MVWLTSFEISSIASYLSLSTSQGLVEELQKFNIGFSEFSGTTIAVARYIDY